jgi:hypothetical protein
MEETNEIIMECCKQYLHKVCFIKLLLNNYLKCIICKKQLNNLKTRLEFSDIVKIYEKGNYEERQKTFDNLCLIGELYDINYKKMREKRQKFYLTLLLIMYMSFIVIILLIIIISILINGNK